MSEHLICPECHNDLEGYIETVKKIRSQLKHVTNRSMDYIRCPRCALEVRLLPDPEKGYRIHAPGMGRGGMRGMRATGGPGFGGIPDMGTMGEEGMLGRGPMGGPPPEGGTGEEEEEWGEEAGEGKEEEENSDETGEEDPQGPDAKR